MGAVRQLCKNGIVLNSGQIIYAGEINKCVNNYLNIETLSTALIIDHLTKIDNRIQLKKISINNQLSDQIYITPDQTMLKIEVAGEIYVPLKFDIEIRISDIYGNVLALFSPGHKKGIAESFIPGSFTLKRTLNFPPGITRGDYYLDLSLADPNYHLWANIPRGVHIFAEGTPTLSGRTIEYTSGAGWLLLD